MDCELVLITEASAGGYLDAYILQHERAKECNLRLDKARTANESNN